MAPAVEIDGSLDEYIARWACAFPPDIPAHHVYQRVRPGHPPAGFDYYPWMTGRAGNWVARAVRAVERSAGESSSHPTQSS